MIFKNILQHPLPSLLTGSVLTAPATLAAKIFALAFNAGQRRKHFYLPVSNRITLPYTIF